MTDVAGLTVFFLASLAITFVVVVGMTFVMDFALRNFLPRRARRWYRMRAGVCGACDVSGAPPDCDDDDRAARLGLTGCRRYVARVGP